MSTSTRSPSPVRSETSVASSNTTSSLHNHQQVPKTGFWYQSILVDTERAVSDMVASLLACTTIRNARLGPDVPKNTITKTLPDLYIDLEGVSLCRDGTVSIVQIYSETSHMLYLVDVYLLQEKAFSTTAPSSSTTLRDILQSADIPKVFFDCRNDSDALFAHYNIGLRAVHDLQVMEYASDFPDWYRTKYRFTKKTHIRGLAACIERDAPLDASLLQAANDIKRRGGNLFKDTELGFGIFEQRPLNPLIRAYCEQDVYIMPLLYGVYRDKLNDPMRAMALDYSERRIKESQNPDYDPYCQYKCLGPWKYSEEEHSHLFKVFHLPRPPPPKKLLFPGDEMYGKPVAPPPLIRPDTRVEKPEEDFEW